MIKSCRKYWTKDIADSIVQLKGIRFVNPQLDSRRPSTREDYTRMLVEQFKVDRAHVEEFYDHLRAMNFYDNNPETTGQMFARYFPGRDDVQRLLMEPIAYANGSTLDDPAITYGIVFSNFMSKGVYTFRGGTDLLIEKMIAELERNGVEMRKKACWWSGSSSRSATAGVSRGIVANGREIRAKAVLSNANIKNTVFRLAGAENFPADYVAAAEAVRINACSCQVYLGIRKGESIPHIGDLVFTSAAPEFTSEELVAKCTPPAAPSPSTIPDTRPGSDRYTCCHRYNAHYEDWDKLPDEEYEREKNSV